MKVKLYSIFNHWYNENRGTIFLYSDPHFGDNDHKLMLGDNAATVAEIDALQVSNINKVVHKYDTLIFLGDLGIGWEAEIKKLKCRNLILIKGNHDAGSERYIDYFKEIYEGPLFIAPKLLLSHEPLLGACYLNIHGHTHERNRHCGYNEADLCSEKNCFTPVRLEKVLENKPLSEIDSIHRITINNAIKRKN